MKRHPHPGTLVKKPMIPESLFAIVSLAPASVAKTIGFVSQSSGSG